MPGKGSAVPSDLFPYVHQFIVECGLTKTASAFKKEVVRSTNNKVKLEDPPITLLELYQQHLTSGTRGHDAAASDAKSVKKRVAAALEQSVFNGLTVGDVAKGKALPKKTKAAPSSSDSSSESSDSSSSEDEKPAAKKAPVKKAAKKQPPPPSSSSESDSDSSEDEPAPKKKVDLVKKAATPAKASNKKAKESSSSSSDDSSSSDEEPAKKKTPAKKTATPAKTSTKKAKESSSSSSSSSDDSSEESSSSDEEPAPKKKAKGKSVSLPATPVVSKKRKHEEDSTPAEAPGSAGKAKKGKSPGTPFRRIIAENISVDDRLRDNSFEAKRGSPGDWGSRANDALRVTKGKSFRHEKTKKKRGSYRGGNLDMGVNSIMFDSD